MSERYLDRPANVLLAFCHVLRSAWPPVGTRAIVTIPLFVLAMGAALALVVGLLVALAVSTGALEPMQVAALSVGLSVPFIALLFVAHQAWFGVLPAAAVLGTIAMTLAMLLTDPVRMVGMTLIYYDLRVRHEGYDLALLAAELEAA